MDKNKLFLIDAHALCYRSFFAIRDLQTSKGQPTNAVYGFISTLKKILRVFGPEYMAVCFDSKEKTYREKKYAEYKIQRPTMPDPLISQIPIIKDVVRAYNIPVFELGGFEADDIIATLTDQAANKGLDVVIVTDDKDMYQLLDEKVKIYSARKDLLLDYDSVNNNLGFDPKLITDFIGLAGDKSDNIPGISGVGEVTAKKLLSQYGSIEKIFENIEDISSQKIKEKLLSQKDMAFFSRELAVLEKKVPFDLDLSQLKVEAPDNNRLFELFNDLEFKKFSQELTVYDKEHQNISKIEVKTKKEVEDLLSSIKSKEQFSFLFRTSKEEELSYQEEVYISLGAGDVFVLSLNEIKELRDVFEDADILKITYDLKTAFKLLREKGVSLSGNAFDVMIAGYLLAPSESFFKFENLSWNYLKMSVSENDDLTRHCEIVCRLYPLLNNELKEKELLELFDKIEMPLVKVLAEMEMSGVNLDVGLLKELSKESDIKLSELVKQIYDKSGEQFNINSPKQLSHVLFDILKLPVVKKTKTGFSTDEEVLVKLSSKHEVPAFILDYRQLSKLKSTYIDALPKLVDPKTGRLHAEFNQTGTETGRLSSSHPNLQNIPIRTELGKQVRKAIIPSKGCVLISADYSQIELRILAHLSGDKNLIDAFKNDEDIHQYTASLIFDVDEKKVTAQMRDSAKRVNFGIIYGISPFGLAKDLGISNNEAQDFIDRYFLRYPDVKKFMDNTIKDCEEKGYVVTLLNRRRYIPEINIKNITIRQFAQRQAINTPVQGSAADLIKLSMINIDREIKKLNLRSKMIITVHDELVFDTYKQEEDEMIALIKNIMENSLKLSVPVKASIKAARNWLEVK